jgi:3-hydroxybutyryl-CoA dehydrogenase
MAGKIGTVGVVGAGQMGGGIAQVFAQAGHRVVLRDISRAFVDRGLETIGKNLQRAVDKGKLAADEKAAVVSRIEGVTELSAFSACDLVVEAIVEETAAKLELFAALDTVAPPGAILASNTSSISITKIAAATGRPAQVIGMHFMNPVPVMKLVEIIRGLATSDETFAAVRDSALALGKTPVEAHDFPGFISNRVLMPMINEACFALMEGVGSAEAIDTVLKLGMNHPMGPLELADFIGLDTCLSILEVLQREMGDDRYRPCPLLRKHVEAGWVGRKSGRGFYQYAK